MPRINYQSGLKLHPGQTLIDACAARFINVSCGRRAGKTAYGMHRLAKAACADTGGEDSLYWWGAPTFKRSSQAYEKFERVLKPVIKKARRSTYQIDLVNDVRIEFVSLKEWENLKGEGLKGAVVDEAALVVQGAFYELIRPSLSDHLGWYLGLSTPRGRNWFYNEFKKGDRKLRADGSANNARDYASFTFPTTCNPYIDPAEIQAAKENMPEDVFLQEYMAKFLEESAGVFRGLLLCKVLDSERHTGFLRYPEPGERCIMGVDLAKHRDYTVICIVSAPRYGQRTQLIHFSRFTQVNWLDQQLEISRLAKQYNAEIWMDVSGPGDRMWEDLNREGLRVNGFQFQSPLNRGELIKTLQVEIANGRICIPETPPAVMEPLWEELQNFEYKITPGGRLTAGPPDEEHDDCVMALGLAIVGATRGGFAIDLTSYHGANQARIIQAVERSPAEHHNLQGLPQGGALTNFFGSGYGQPFIHIQ